MVNMEEIGRLVEEFQKNYAVYANNESQTRQSLIDVMLVNLGWDVTDPKVVRVEPPVETRYGKKKADYILYDDRGYEVVVIEAKAPKVNIAKDTDAVFQLLTYGRGFGSVYVGILTDFEEWEVYNTSVDSPKDTQRVRIPDLCMRFTDYAEKWDTLRAFFSREAVISGKLRAFVTTTKTITPLDDCFLKDLTNYRKLIADSLHRRNDFDYDWNLDECTQRILDRLLLLRILEDRGYGDRSGWLHRIAEADDPGRHLSDTVLQLQPTFNSRFFKPHTVDRLDADPAKLREVVKELADPDSRYNFASMSVEIIGKAYEQFLGSVIRTTPKQVRLEPKPEVRKAGGVYYTPRYIVDYIVENTLSPLFEGKSLSQAAKIKILDPACGSGSFLIGAARWLERWYSDKYGRPATHEERRTIVLAHLHGVDIDQNAVEVTQLSLCLWLLENAPVQTVMLHEALLPDLSGNVKCGNSLIGSDFYTSAGQQDLFKDKVVQHRVNAFDWDGPHGFPEIMKKKVERRLWFVTFVTHNSRVSERMVDCGVETKEPLIFGLKDQILMAEKITEVCKIHEIPIVTWNVLRDHVHMLIGARSETELDESVQKIKGGSARAYREATGMGKGGHVWAQKFNRKAISGEEELNNVYNYIKENHLKHAAQDKGLQPLALPDQDKELQPLATPDQDKGLQPLAPSHKGLKPLVSDELLAFRRKIEPILDSITVSVEAASQTSGGFDAVIGNPPYVFGRDWKSFNISDEEKLYLGKHYNSSPYQLDMFSLFMEKASILCCYGGYIGQIVPNVWLTNTYSSLTRAFILSQAYNLNIVSPISSVFKGITVDTIVYTYCKAKESGEFITVRAMDEYLVSDILLLDVKEYLDGTLPISTSMDVRTMSIINKVRKNRSALHDFARITRGVHPYRIGGYGETAFGKGCQTQKDVEQRPYNSEIPQAGYRPLIYGRDLHRYSPPVPKEYIKYGRWLAEPRESIFFEGERVYSRKILGDRLVVTIERGDSIADQQVYITLPIANAVGTPYLAAILGSQLISFYIRNLYDEMNDAFPQIKVGQLKQLPIRTIDFNDKQDKARHDKMVSLVERMLELHKKLPNTEGAEKTQIEQLIARTDREIDALVYELYDLTEEERAIVEEATSR